eukprot:CAMPEP_0206584294 /NCGR_PEP_ID=MMETSP0325_2-20121206/35628_1 /ASSEMBLY_ACC=CAM_ASM_000347 /TAXON_ID=2866 /ORGANISM="Crypthecodinium cohnii, Strain Seligo" /LENGTH=946 /DNA_ID=CAMNT_0054091407 /DNA_START=219 /DNA_END=3060 /DNA_ORIENTATION=-
MAGRPLKIPGHRPIARSDERTFSGQPRQSTQHRDPRLGPLARCLSRGRHGRGVGGVIPPARAAADAVAAREACQRRLQRVEQLIRWGPKAGLRCGGELIDALLHMRVLSLDVVETIEQWRRHGRESAIWPDPHTGGNYLLKMKDDTRWLAESPLGEILRFSSKTDPFFVVPSAGSTAQQQQQPPTNQMTPTLQAQRRQQTSQASGKSEARRAILPLPNSLLRRIRAAELYILRESVIVRMQEAGISPSSLNAASMVPPLLLASGAGQGPSVDLAEAAAATYIASHRAKEQAPVSLPSQPVTFQPLQQHRQDDHFRPQEQPPPQPAQPPLATPGTLPYQVPAPSMEARGAVDTHPLAGPPKVRPQRPAPPDATAFWLSPILVTKESAGEVFSQYISRVDPRIAKSMDGWERLEEALEDDGVSAPEWFWLSRRDKGPAQAETMADGLVVFRLQRHSVTFGQLLHLSVVDESFVDDALEAVKAWMFTFQPIKAIRTTLWFNDTNPDTGKIDVNKQFEAHFMKTRFKWFTLCNTNGGVRGKTLQRPRGEPPDDPQVPAESFGLEVCLGQVWLRGCRGSAGPTTSTSCASSSIVLSSAALQQFWTRDALAVQQAKEASGEAKELADAHAAVKEGLVRSLLSGQLDRLMTKFAPQALHSVSGKDEEQSVPLGASSSSRSLGLTKALAKLLGPAGVPKRGRSVPGTIIQAADSPTAGLELVRSGLSAEGYSEAIRGLSLQESVTGAVEALLPEETVLARLHLSLDWMGVSAYQDGSFEVALQAVGNCSRHPQPVFYVGTGDEEVFVVVIPWTGLPLPDEEAIYVECTDILRATVPMERSPYQALRFPSEFDVRRKMASSSLPDAPSTLELPGAASGAGGDGASPTVPPGSVYTSPVQMLHFSSLSVGPGRHTPGKLPGSNSVSVFEVQRPFALCLFHTEIDDLNAPLTATLVL